MAKKGDVVTITGQDEMIEHFANIGSEGVVIFEDYHPLFDGYHIVAFTDGQVFPNGQSLQAIADELLEVTGSVSEEEVEALEIITGFVDEE